MKAKIHYTLLDDSEDAIVLCGTPDEIREKAEVELQRRGGFDPWSEILEE